MGGISSRDLVDLSRSDLASSLSRAVLALLPRTMTMGLFASGGQISRMIYPPPPETVLRSSSSRVDIRHRSAFGGEHHGGQIKISLAGH